MEPPGSNKGKSKKWLVVLMLLALLGGAGYGFYTDRLSVPSWLRSLAGPAESKTVKGVVRDLRAMKIRDGDIGVGDRLNVFILESETGELVPLVFDYDNHGLKNGDRVSVTYEVDTRRYKLIDPSDNENPYIARLNKVIDFKLVKDLPEGK